MYNWIHDILMSTKLDKYTGFVAYTLSIIVMLLICITLRNIIKIIVVKITYRVVKKTKHDWDDILYKNKLFHRLSDLSVPVAFSFFIRTLPEQNGILETMSTTAAIIIVIFCINSIINSVDEIYSGFEISKAMPLRGVFQVIKVIVFVFGGIVVIATLIGESPTVLIGSLGAMTAVTSIVFKDAILGFVAGIQLTSNDMIKIGDWIDIPKSSANGTVIDLTMTTVRVRNFDNSISLIPAYSLVSDAFINWRGLQSSGGRRIKREMFINASGVRLCDDEMLARFKKIELIRDYISLKNEEIVKYNAAHDMSEPVNGRSLTNIGTFRVYILEYLKNHPGIHKNMTLMVRQLDAGDSGIPLEIYAFANTVDWVEYENIQSDIFDHLYSIVEHFGLSVYQRPSGHDISLINK